MTILGRAMSRRLTRFRVEGLFGLYTHDISLNESSRVTAIIGQNGLGKTICLKLIDGILNRKYSIFYTVQFTSCNYYFDDGASVSVAWGDIPSLPLQLEKDESRRLIFEVRWPSGDAITWQPSEHLKLMSKHFRDVGRYVPFLTQMSAESWIDDRTGLRLTPIEMMQLSEQFGISLPDKKIWNSQEAQAFLDLLDGARCHLIETQRLLVIPETDQDIQIRRRTGSIAEGSTQLAVERKAQILSGQIKAILTQYASLSQSLDRSFPQRILRGHSMHVLGRKEIDRKLAELEARRRALEGAGILEQETESVTEVPEDMDSVTQRVISIYVDDTSRKLDTFQALQQKIQLFEVLIQKRFTDKKLSINPNSGFAVTSTAGRPVPLRTLSSGEQHQLVLIFELLFETSSGDLILIDEPELSLHVAWQKSFVDDLLKIIEANPFDAVLATHSPVLIGHHFDLAVELERRSDDLLN